MSSIEEISGDNRWVVYLKSETENEQKKDEEIENEDEQMENKGEQMEDEEQRKEDLVQWIMSDIEKAAGSDTPTVGKTAAVGTVPIKSKEKYETTYNNFKTWMDVNQIKDISQKTMLKYLKKLSKEKKPTTLWGVYSMLKTTIYSHDKVDISMYTQLNVYLKKLAVGYKVKEIKAFTANEIERFLKEAPDNIYLATKVVLVLGIIGELRRMEYCNITLDDIEDTGSTAIIKIANRGTGDPRLVTITGKFYDIFKKYANLRPNTPLNRFFLKYVNGRCAHQVIGIHKFGFMIKDIAKFLKLPDPDCYTSYSFRRSSVGKLLADWGASPEQFTHQCGCRFNKLTGRCTEDTTEVRRKLPRRVSEPETADLLLDGEQSGTQTPPAKRRKNENIPDVDPLQISSDKSTTETVNAGSAGKMPGPVMQLSPSNSSSETALKLTPKPVVQAQLNKIVQVPPPSQQQSQPKTVLIKAIPLNVKEGTQTFKIQPTQQVPPVVASQKPAEVCVKWNNHHNNMQTTFPSLLNSEEFVDVTLACEGKSLKCHKVILSSCSDYLATLLRENPCQHPIILMKDLKFWQVEALITFMYKGEVNVPQDRLTQLLEAAEALQVKGLVGSSPPQFQQPTTPIPQEKTQTPTPVIPVPKTVQTKNPKGSTSFPMLVPCTSKTTSEHVLGSKNPRPIIRLQNCKTPTSQTQRFVFKARSTQSTSTLLRSTLPEVKSEPPEIPQTSADGTAENNDGSSPSIYENVVALQEVDDPGGQEQLGSVDDDVQLEFEAIQDIKDTKEFIPIASLEQEQNINEYDDNIRDTLLDIKDFDTKVEMSESDYKSRDVTKWTEDKT